MKKKIFFIPNAGGTSYIFNDFKKLVHESCELHLLDLPGRANKAEEPFILNLKEAKEYLTQLIEPLLEAGMEYSFFGYSMGALLALEMTEIMRKRLNKDPFHLFFAGRYPPHINRDIEAFSVMSYGEFSQAIIALGGMPLEIAQCADIKDYYMNIIWNDFQIIKNYEFDFFDFKKYQCGISVFGGDVDKFTSFEDLKEWHSYSAKECRVYNFNDGHFFIKNYAREICSVINKNLP